MTCENCGEELEGTARRRFCGVTCRVAAWRAGGGPSVEPDVTLGTDHPSRNVYESGTFEKSGHEWKDQGGFDRCGRCAAARSVGARSRPDTQCRLGGRMPTGMLYAMAEEQAASRWWR